MRCIFIFSLIVSTLPALMGQIKATTDTGKEVLLLGNGTWQYAGEAAAADSIPLQEYYLPDAAQQYVEGKYVFYTHFYDADKWIREPSSFSDSKEYSFSLKNSYVFAQIVPERIKMDMNFLKTAAFQNAQAESQDIRIIYDEMCRVNGVLTNKVIMRGSIHEDDITYYCLYYAGSRGVVQVVAQCATADFKKYKKDMEEFLYGFTLLIEKP